MQYNGTEVVDTFAEAFPMLAARLVVTAIDQAWCQTVATTATGYATSVIGCDCEAGIERYLSPDQTPDGRPGVSLLFFAFDHDKLSAALTQRIGQCVLTCPTTACYDGFPGGTEETSSAKRLRIGGLLRYFGDGYQSSKKLGQRRFWRIPVLDGEFLCEDTFGTTEGVAGGNLLILGTDQPVTLAATRRAVAAMQEVPEIILPFPGGIARSGSKVGSRYPNLLASTSDRYCPTLRGLPTGSSAVPEPVNAVYEIVVDGLTEERVAESMKRGIQAAAGPNVLQISAGNYGGKLGPFHFRLSDVLGEWGQPQNKLIRT